MTFEHAPSSDRAALPAASRRGFLRNAVLGAAAVPVLGACATPITGKGRFAEELTRTPRQTPGPFYPDPLPLTQDNDLVNLSDDLTPAVGEITDLYGTVLSSSGEPLRNATVEIWQADDTGAYLHEESDGHDERDPNFQGFGRFETDSTGRYHFRTVKPGKYPGRARHIHMLVEYRGHRVLTTQLYIRGDESNQGDDSLEGIPTAAERELVLVDYVPNPASSVGELLAHKDIIVGLTPEDPEAD